MATATFSFSFSGYARTLSLSPSSSRCLLKNRCGLGAQSSGLLCGERSDFSSAYHMKVKQSVRSRRRLKGGCRANMIMMTFWIPIVRYKIAGLGWQWADLDSALYRNRIICLDQFIDDDFSSMLLGTLLYLDSVNHSEVLNILVMGLGGDVSPTLQIYDTLESLRSPVSTTAISHISSLSGYILAAGDKGKRYALPDSTIAFQPIYGVARGQADDIISEANGLVKIRDYLFKELSLKTGQPLEKIKTDFEHYKFFSSQEALEYGLIDKITRPPRIKAPIEEQTGDGLG